MRSQLVLWLTILCACLSNSIFAAEEPREQSASTNDDYQFETVGKFNFDLLIGSFHINSPINTEEDIDLFVLPKLSYYGERIYFENTTVGYSLIENDDWSIDLVGRLNLDAVYFHTNNDELHTFVNFLSADIPILTPFGVDLPLIEERKYSYMAGVTLNRQLGESYQADLLLTKDISNRHDGLEADLSLTHSSASDEFGYSLKLGVIIKDSKLSSYYYGLRQSETIEMSFPHYEITSTTFSPYLKATIEKSLAESVSLYFSYQSTQFDSKISDSILVVDEQVNTRFIGVKYRF